MSITLGGMVEFLKVCLQIPRIKRAAQVLSRVDKLEKQVAIHAELLGGKPPPQFCDKCRKPTAVFDSRRLTETKPALIREEWHCTSCPESFTRYIKIK